MIILYFLSSVCHDDLNIYQLNNSYIFSGFIIVQIISNTIIIFKLSYFRCFDLSFLCKIFFRVEILAKLIACVFHMFPFNYVKIFEFSL